MRIIAWVLTLAALAAPALALADQQPDSRTVLGPSNELLQDGSTALEQGRVQEGVRLTLEGLKYPASVREMAAGHANLCAGYALLQRWDEALVHCNASINLDPENWRAYNNRAAVFSARGLYDQAISDVQAGLKIAPGSTTLHHALEIIEHNRSVGLRQRRRGTNA